MVHIVARFLQRAESYAYSAGLPYSDYRLLSQPENVYGLKLDARDRIIAVGEIPNRLWDALEAVRSKCPTAPPIERVWLSNGV